MPNLDFLLISHLPSRPIANDRLNHRFTLAIAKGNRHKNLPIPVPPKSLSYAAIKGEIHITKRLKKPFLTPASAFWLPIYDPLRTTA